jgi:sulfur carrier protein ThiS
MNKKGVGPISAVDDVSPTDVRATLRTLEQFRKLPRVRTDEEVGERLDQFFSMCDSSGVRPGIELMALALGVTRATIYNWSEGIKCSPERQRLVQAAKQTLAAYLEQLGATGKINPVTLIWWQRNHWGYKETTTLEISRPSDALLTAEQSPEEIAAAIEADVIPNDDY